VYIKRRRFGYATRPFFGLLALAISHLPAGPSPAVAALAAVVVLGAIGFLERAPNERQTRKK
jgi:hypothetical protein